MNEPEERQDEIDSIAADWAARLGGASLNEAERRELDLWLDQSPRHAAAFAEARAAWVRMGALRDAPGALSRDPATAVSEARARSVAARDRRSRGRWGRAAALAACVLIAVGAARFWLGDPRTLMTADHRTAPGAQERVTLADGSSVALGPASAIALRFTEGERRIELLAGLAYFAATPLSEGERRPFVVAAANGTARALGTEFMVERLGETVEVAVIAHEVAVALDAPDRQPAEVVVPPGGAVRYTGSALGEVRPVNLDHATAWRRGRLIFDREPLGTVVAELNRYRRGRIVIAGPALAARRVSGVFDTADPEGALATIIRDLRIGALSLPPLMTLLY